MNFLTPNMIEKVARNIFKGWRATMDAANDFEGPRYYEDLDENELEFGMVAAKHAIEAMLEPTVGMLESGIKTDVDSEHHTPCYQHWRAMIQAALDGK